MELQVITDYITQFGNIGIAVFVFFTMQAIKATNKVEHSYIPLMAGVLGMALGVALFYQLGDGTLVEAIMNGGISGFATTGMYETIKKSMGANEPKIVTDIKELD